MTFDKLVKIYLTESKKSGPPYIVKTTDGTCYYKDPKHKILHRDEKDPVTGLSLPAIEYSDGSKQWWVDGKPHRDEKDINGLSLPAVKWADGSKEWWFGGKRHRDEKDINGFSLPAIEDADRSKYWFVDDMRHRLDGPAIEYYNGKEEYWIKGKQLTKKEFDEYRASLDIADTVSKTGNQIIPGNIVRGLLDLD